MRDERITAIERTAIKLVISVLGAYADEHAAHDDWTACNILWDAVDMLRDEFIRDPEALGSSDLGDNHPSAPDERQAYLEHEALSWKVTVEDRDH